MVAVACAERVVAFERASEQIRELELVIVAVHEQVLRVDVGELAVHAAANLLVHVVLAWYVAESGAGQRAVYPRRILAQIQIVCAHV